MRAIILTLFAAALPGVALPSNGHAGGTDTDLVKIDPDPIIEHCWDISRADRDSGVTSRMVAGTWESTECLKEEIVRHATALIAPDVQDEIDIRVTLRNLSRAYGGLYHDMYNSRRSCARSSYGHPLCGTMYRVLPAGAVGDLFERILRDLIKLRNVEAR